MPRGGKRPGAGRPRHKASEKLSKRIWARVTEEEYRELATAAKAANMTLPDWIRERLLVR